MNETPQTGVLPPDVPAPGLEDSLALLDRARAGDLAAIEMLATRWLPRLQRWATGRLPAYARDLAETQDLVQETVFQAFKGISRFEVRGEGSLQAYLRHAVMNRIRMEIRRVGRKPSGELLGAEIVSEDPSPLELAVGREVVEAYETALAALGAEDRELIIGRIEMGLTNVELAALVDKPSANAARMAVERALVRLAKRMPR